MRLPAALRKFVADSEDEVYFLIRLLIFAVNVIAWIFSICFICISIWILQEKADLGIDNLSSDPAIVLLVIGSILFIITFTGCVGTLRENLFLLKLVSLYLTSCCLNVLSRRFSDVTWKISFSLAVYGNDCDSILH
jgi:hypothetical protein